LKSPQRKPFFLLRLMTTFESKTVSEIVVFVETETDAASVSGNINKEMKNTKMYFFMILKIKDYYLLVPARIMAHLKPIVEVAES
jgi:hypothetical protein